jgi:2-dehydro-3-deoxy-L-rhamnonate dehydrogenase (NAD+)
MNNSFQNQIVIITGAASGLGLAITTKLSQEGALLALMDRDAAGLEKLKKLFTVNAIFFAIDITSEELVKDAVHKTAAHFGKIDVLINCAGITGKTNVKSHEVDTRNLQQVFDVNFMGSWFTSKYVLPQMLKNNYGRILHVASIAGKEGNAGMLAYSASKAAVIAMAKVQGKEYAETGITVNAIAPAVIQTPLVEVMPESQVKYMTDKIPMKRCGTLEEIADMVAFVVSEKNSFTTGFTFDLSGGRAVY